MTSTYDSWQQAQAPAATPQPFTVRPAPGARDRLSCPACDGTEFWLSEAGYVYCDNGECGAAIGSWSMRPEGSPS